MSKLATKGLNGLKNKKEKEFIQDIVSNRSANVREESYYVVDMYENGQLVESRPIVGHSRSYADDCARNWNIGIIKK